MKEKKKKYWSITINTYDLTHNELFLPSFSIQYTLYITFFYSWIGALCGSVCVDHTTCAYDQCILYTVSNTYILNTVCERITRVKLAMRVLIHYFCFSFSFELATNASGLRDHILISVKFISNSIFFIIINLIL